MSRIANNPITVPNGVDIAINDQQIVIKGGKGTLEHKLHALVGVTLEEGRIKVAARDTSKQATALAGTSRAVLNNMVTGVTAGFERKLTIIGVGYRAQVAGKKLNLSLGFSHPVNFPIPDDISIEVPTQTEVVVKGIDKQRVGQVASEIRAYRPPEPYKGKGVRYTDEHVLRKEAKKTA
jgi:large subunit ribosomal protein L6